MAQTHQTQGHTGAPVPAPSHAQGRTTGRFPYTYCAATHWYVYDPDSLDPQTGAPTGRKYTVEEWVAERGDSLPALVGGEAIIRAECGGCGAWPEVLRRVRGTTEDWRCIKCYHPED